MSIGDNGRRPLPSHPGPTEEELREDRRGEGRAVGRGEDSSALPGQPGGIATAPLRQPMSSGTGPRRDQDLRAVVVGVDGSLGVLTAVSWAAAEAACRGVELRLVHVERVGCDGSTEGRRSLHRALAATAALAPGVAVTVVTVTVVRSTGAVGPTLARYSRRACLLVVGGRRPSDGGPSAGRTASDVVARAACPVVVVPPRQTGAWASTLSSRPILAGVMTDSDRRALAVAEATAARRGAPLVVVGDRAGTLSRAGTRTRGRAVRATSIEPAQDLATTLRDLGRRAQLIVVGRSRSPHSTPHTQDPLVADLLQRSPCPVLVAPLGEECSGRGRQRSENAVPLAAPPLLCPGREVPERTAQPTSPSSHIHGGTPDDHERPSVVEPAGV